MNNNGMLKDDFNKKKNLIIVLLIILLIILIIYNFIEKKIVNNGQNILENIENFINENIEEEFIEEETNEYTLEELEKMALDYYELKTGERPDFVSAVKNDDDLIHIQLYDLYNGPNTTVVYYTIDPLTAIGYDSEGNKVDFNEIYLENNCKYNTENNNDNLELKQLCIKENSKRILVSNDTDLTELIKINNIEELEKFNNEVFMLYQAGTVNKFDNIKNDLDTAISITFHYLTNYNGGSGLYCYNKEYVNEKVNELFGVYINGITNNTKTLDVLTNYYCPTTVLGGAGISGKYLTKVTDGNKISYIYKIEHEFNEEKNESISINYEYVNDSYILKSIMKIDW